jgi:UDP-2,3-diacylglucosamine pyrophosphatase LpxH
MNHYRTAWISDVHLGTKGCKAEALLAFLRDHECETLYIVGDLIDVWAMRRGVFWPQSHSDVLQKILRKGRKGTEIIYITGNHDEFFEDFHGHYASVSIQKNAVHLLADGRRLLVIHGHELDTVVQNLGWLAHVGDIGYALLMRCNGLLNAVRRRCGLGYWSLSAYVKAGVKNVVSFIGQFEESIVRYARDFDVDAVLCGHIHTAAHRVVEGVEYWNTGDWVESCTAVVEHFDGRLELRKFQLDPTAAADDLNCQEVASSSDLPSSALASAALASVAAEAGVSVPSPTTSISRRHEREI